MSEKEQQKIDQAALIAQARKSGLSYNEAKEWIAKNTGGFGTHIYSDTDFSAVRERLKEKNRNLF